MTRTWILRVLMAGGLLCDLATLAPAQTLIQGTFREDAAHTSGDPGIFTLAVRRAIGSGLCGSDGDYCALQVDANGALHVVFANTTIAVTNAGTFAVQAAQSGTWTVQTQDTESLPDDAAFLPASHSVFPMGAFADDTAPDSVNEGDIGAPRMSLRRELYFQLRDAAGNERGANVTAGNALVVDGSASGASTLAEQQSQTTALQIIDNLPVAQGSTTSGQSGALVQGAVTTAAPSYTTGQTSPLSLTEDGELRVAGSFSGGGDGAIQDGASSSIEATVLDYSNSNPLAVRLTDTTGDYVGAGAGTQYNQGTATTDTDTMTMAGAVRRDTAAVATGVADGDRLALSTDSAGRLRVTAVDTTQPVSGTVTVTDGAGALNVIVDSSALPSGASTSANQTTVIGHVDGLEGLLTTIDADTGTLAGAVSGTEVQVDVLTMPTVTVTDGAGAMNVIVDSGTITANLGATDNAVLDDIADGIPVTNAGTFAVQDSTAQASLSVVDDWDESDRAKVNPIVGQAGVQGGAGAVSANSQRVAIATDANVVDRTAVAAANNDGACVTVDTTSDTILASFSTRRAALIRNAGSVLVYIKLGGTATTSDFPLPAGAAIPIGSTSTYTGVIDGITASSSTSICVMEW